MRRTEERIEIIEKKIELLEKAEIHRGLQECLPEQITKCCGKKPELVQDENSVFGPVYIIKCKICKREAIMDTLGDGCQNWEKLFHVGKEGINEHT